MEMIVIIIVEIARWLVEDLPEKIQDVAENLNDLQIYKELGSLLIMIALPVVLFLFLILFGPIASA